MLRIGIIVVLMIVPGCPMPVKESEDATIFEDDIIIKTIPDTTKPPAAMNVFEDHVFLRKKREAENPQSLADKSSLYGEETHWWKNQKTSVEPVFPNKVENVFEDHFIMNRKPDRESVVAEDNIMMKTDSDSNALSVFEDNVMMRQGNIFEDNIAMKQDEQTQNVFEDDIIMKQKQEELDQGVNPYPASPTSMSVDRANSVYEDNIMLRKRAASQNLESAGIIEDDIAMREGARQDIFEDHVMLQNQHNSASEKVSNVFEDHVIMREDAETSTISQDTQDATNPKASVFEDNIMMRSDSEKIDSSSQKVVIEDNLVMREGAAEDQTKGSFVTEDHVIVRTSNGNSETEFGSSGTAEKKNQQSLIIIEDHLLRKRRAANRDAKDSILEDNVLLHKDNTQSSTGSAAVPEKQSLIIIDDHLLRKRRAGNRNTKDSILEDNVMLKNDNTQSSPGSAAVPEKNNHQSLIIIEDHLIRKRRAANRDAKDSILKDNVMLQNDNTQSSPGSAAVPEKNNHQSLIIIEDHLIRKRRAANRDAKDSILEDNVMLQNDNTHSSGSAAARDKTNHQSLIVTEDHLLRK